MLGYGAFGEVAIGEVRSSTAQLFGRALVAARATAAITTKAPLSARTAVTARASAPFASIFLPITARSALSVRAKVIFSGTAPVTARSLTSARAVGVASVKVPLRSTALTAAQAKAAPSSLALAMSGRTLASAQSTAAPSGIVSLFGTVLTSIQAAVAETRFVALEAMAALQLKFKGMPNSLPLALTATSLSSSWSLAPLRFMFRLHARTLLTLRSSAPVRPSLTLSAVATTQAKSKMRFPRMPLSLSGAATAMQAKVSARARVVAPLRGKARTSIRASTAFPAVIALPLRAATRLSARMRTSSRFAFAPLYGATKVTLRASGTAVYRLHLYARSLATASFRGRITGILPTLIGRALAMLWARGLFKKLYPPGIPSRALASDEAMFAAQADTIAAAQANPSDQALWTATASDIKANP